MRRAIEKKLNSTRGASMLLALLFLLVCLCVGAVVLTAASANTGRLARNRAEQQAYLAVSSAMELVKEEFTGGQPMAFVSGYSVTVTETYHPAEKDGEGNVIRDAYTTTSEPAYGKNGGRLDNSSLLSAALTDLKTLCYSTKPVLGETAPVQMEYDLTVAAGGELPEVKGTISVITESGVRGPRYTVIVTLYTVVDGVNSNIMTMTLSPRETETWNTVSATNEDKTVTTTTTTYTTTITWGDPVITKGAE